MAIPPIGASESVTRVAVQGPEGIAQRRAKRALDRDLARLHDRAPEGWQLFAGPAPPLTRCGTQPYDRPRGQVRADAAVARQGKRRQAAPGARRLPVKAQPVSGRQLRRVRSQRILRGALTKIGGQPGSGALRAPLKT